MRHSLFSAFALLCGWFSVTEAADGSLLVTKSLSKDFIVVGDSFDVNIYIYNVGDGAAFDVRVSDTHWKESSFDLVAGEKSAKFDRIEAGSNVTHTFTLKPLRSGVLNDEPALYAYKSNFAANEKENGVSSTLGRFQVITRDEYNNYYAKHTMEWAIFSCITGFMILVPKTLSTQANNSLNKLLKRA